MRKKIKIMAVLVCLLLAFAGCGSQVVDLTIDGTMIYFDSMKDAGTFISQVQDGSIDYDAYEVPTIVKTCAVSAGLDELEYLAYFETVGEGMSLDCVLVGNGSVCVVYDMGLDFTDAGLTQSEEYYLNTLTLTTYVTDDVDTLFDGFYSSGSFTKSDDGNSFYGAYESYGTMSVIKGVDNQLLVMYYPITFGAELAEASQMAFYQFD